MGPGERSRYSSNFARRLGDGRSKYPRYPASTSPSTLTPPSLNWAPAGSGRASDPSPTRKTTAISPADRIWLMVSS
jgi:hypothetical protein